MEYECVFVRFDNLLMVSDVNWYSILGLSTTCSEEEIKQAYHRIALKHHPDKGKGDVETFKLAVEAYRVLSDPEQRRQLDANLKAKTPRHSEPPRKSDASVPEYDEVMKEWFKRRAQSRRGFGSQSASAQKTTSADRKHSAPLRRPATSSFDYDAFQDAAPPTSKSRYFSNMNWQSKMHDAYTQAANDADLQTPIINLTGDEKDAVSENPKAGTPPPSPSRRKNEFDLPNNAKKFKVDLDDLRKVPPFTQFHNFWDFQNLSDAMPETEHAFRQYNRRADQPPYQKNPLPQIPAFHPIPMHQIFGKDYSMPHIRYPALVTDTPSRYTLDNWDTQYSDFVSYSSAMSMAFARGFQYLQSNPAPRVSDFETIQTFCRSGREDIILMEHWLQIYKVHVSLVEQLMNEVFR